MCLRLVWVLYLMVCAYVGVAQHKGHYSAFVSMGHAFTFSEQKNNRAEFNWVTTLGLGYSRNLRSNSVFLDCGLRISRVEINNFKTTVYYKRAPFSRDFSESFRTLYLEVPFGMSYRFKNSLSIGLSVVNEFMLGTTFTGNYGVLNFFKGEGGAGLDFHNYSVEGRVSGVLFKPFGLYYTLLGKMNLQNQTPHDLSTIQPFRLFALQVGVAKQF